MKIELKHIAPYLPSQLTYWNANLKHEKEIGLSNVYLLFSNAHLKIILRPLSDLLKEVEIDGKKFVPIDKLKATYLLTPEQINQLK